MHHLGQHKPPQLVNAVLVRFANQLQQLCFVFLVIAVVVVVIVVVVVVVVVVECHILDESLLYVKSEIEGVCNFLSQMY